MSLSLCGKRTKNSHPSESGGGYERTIEQWKEAKNKSQPGRGDKGDTLSWVNLDLNPHSPFGSCAALGVLFDFSELQFPYFI